MHDSVCGYTVHCAFQYRMRFMNTNVTKAKTCFLLAFSQEMPSRIAKFVFAILTVVIFVIIVVLAITLSLKDGDEAKSSGIVGITTHLSFNIHPFIAALMDTKKNKRFWPKAGLDS